MGKFIFGFIIGIIVIPLGVLWYVKSGKVPVAATAKPMPFEKYLAQAGLHATAEREAPQRALSSFTAADLTAGATVYLNNCAGCHGLPNKPPSKMAAGMFPHAPQFFTPEGSMTDDPVGESYWKVKNGIRLSGMPSFEKILADEQMWQASAIIAGADKLPPGALQVLKNEPAAKGRGSTPKP